MDQTVTTHFETTPLTSTYLVAFIVSDFKYKTNTNGSDIFRHRTYATPAQVENTDFALHEGEKILNAISNYLNVPFTLPKMDQVGVPDFAAGGITLVILPILCFVYTYFSLLFFSNMHQLWKTGVRLEFNWK